jgi:8-hydroxy-5-deazaflavin:NADPH oxidoreductase
MRRSNVARPNASFRNGKKQSMDQLPAIAILGGSGELGSALARRWAQAGYPVIIGSRSSDRAIEAAARIGRQVRGAENILAAAAAEIIVVAVPYSNHVDTLQAIRQVASGKIVVDVVVPLVPPKVSVVQIPQGGSAALEAKAILGAGVRVVSAFHNVGAAKLHAGGKVDCDVLVFADDRAPRDLVITLARAAGMRGIDGGGLANSVAAEALTSVLIGINRRYKVNGAGIRITGIPLESSS